MEWFVKALVMGWVAWQPEQRFWKIDTNNEDLKVFDNEKRGVLFKRLFLLGDLPQELQEYWQNLLGDVAQINQKFAAAIVRDGNNWDVSGYLTNPAVNRYWKSVNPAKKGGQFGTTYYNKQGGPTEVEQLKVEVEVLKKIAAALEEGDYS